MTEQLFDLWVKSSKGNIKHPKGIFRLCPHCGKRLCLKRYKLAEINDAVIDILHYICTCGYQYCSMKYYAIMLHHPKYDGGAPEDVRFASVVMSQRIIW